MQLKLLIDTWYVIENKNNYLTTCYINILIIFFKLW